MSVLGRIWSQARRSVRSPATRGCDASAFGEQAAAAEAAGDVEAALALLARLRAAAATAPEAYWRVGRVLGRAGRLDEARDALEAARGLDPALGDVDSDLGNVAALGGRLDDAERHYRAALVRHPGHPEMLANLGQLLRVRRQPAAARAAFAQALESDPECAPALKGFAAVAQERDDLDRVARIVAASPGCAPAHAAYGALLLGVALEPQRALGHFERALALGLDDAEAHGGRGLALRELGQPEAALAELDAALARDPGNGAWRWHRALVLLALGRYAEGWQDYEIRLQSEDRPQRDFGLPRCDGGELAGRSVLVHAEQGLGDEIMFASCLPEVLARARRCIVDCHPKLAGLYRRSFPQALVHAGSQFDDASWLATLGEVDCQVPVGSLPLALRRSAAEFPRHRGYLVADPARVARWRERLAALGARSVIGLSWRGGTRASRRARRSLALEALRPLLEADGVHWVSLQYDAAPGEVENFVAESGVALSHWPEAIDDYEETAALLCALELTVSVCTAVVHLAGALGRPTWVLTPLAPEWRYGHDEPTMPWYPSATMFRQRAGAGWPEVVARVRGALDARLAR